MHWSFLGKDDEVYGWNMEIVVAKVYLGFGKIIVK